MYFWTSLSDLGLITSSNSLPDGQPFLFIFISPCIGVGVCLIEVSVECRKKMFGSQADYCGQKPKPKDRIGENPQTTQGAKIEKLHFVSAKTQNPDQKLAKPAKPKFRRPSSMKETTFCPCNEHCLDYCVVYNYVLAILIGQSKKWGCLGMTSTSPRCCRNALNLECL